MCLELASIEIAWIFAKSGILTPREGSECLLHGFTHRFQLALIPDPWSC